LFTSVKFYVTPGVLFPTYDIFP